MAARRAPRGPQAIETQPETSHVLRISLEGVEPPIWRRLRIRSDATFGDLHRAIQHAVGWQDCHMHQFTVGERRLGRVRDDDGGMGLEDEESTTLTGALPHEGDGCAYEYDFGDSWVHWIQVESVEPKRSQTAFAACLDGARSCPPED